jgi:hypothetical protein
MDLNPRVELERLVRQEPEVMQDPRRARALLQDLCPTKRRETSLLIAALEEGVSETLERAPASVPVVAEIERLAHQLASGRGLDLEAARWAVRSLAWIAERAAPPDDAELDPGVTGPVTPVLVTPLAPADAFETMIPERDESAVHESRAAGPEPVNVTGRGDSRRWILPLAVVVPFGLVVVLLATLDRESVDGPQDGVAAGHELPDPAGDPVEEPTAEDPPSSGGEDDEDAGDVEQKDDPPPAEREPSADNPPINEDPDDADAGDVERRDDPPPAERDPDPRPQEEPPTAANALESVPALSPGYFCRDLHALGYSYADAVWYWDLEGQPARMDASGTGIPCQTVYPSREVAVYWAHRDAVTDLPPGLFCRDLNAGGHTYEEAVWYWRAEGQPARMDAAGNGIPCQTVYSANEVRMYWQG